MRWCAGPRTQRSVREECQGEDLLRKLRASHGTIYSMVPQMWKRCQASLLQIKPLPWSPAQLQARHGQDDTDPARGQLDLFHS